jgi:2-polyprenyl-3-methyl-5-hydroxy-6-metoxy-1,4-benzoquinol methylase
MVSAELEKLGANTVLVDLSQKALSFAKRHLASNGLAARVSLQNGLQLGFRDDAFDVVWNAGVLEHFQDEGKIALMREMYRVVRPGGILFLTVPNALDAPFRLGKLVEQWRGTWKFGYEDDLTPARLRKLGERAGLKQSELFAYNPIVGWWFLPKGRPVCEALGLNTLGWHLKRSRFGHVVTLSAPKPRL